MLPLIALNTVWQERFPSENGGDCALPQFSGCDCFYITYNYKTEESSHDSCHEMTYDYTADWSWGEGGTSASVENHVTGNRDETSMCSQYYEAGDNSGCGCGCNWGSYSSGGCGSGCGFADDIYDETISYTGWKKELPGTLFYTRWSPFSGSLDDSCGGSNNGCFYDYSYSADSFGAPGFSATIWEEVYNDGSGVVHNTGAYASPSGMLPSSVTFQTVLSFHTAPE